MRIRKQRDAMADWDRWLSIAGGSTLLFYGLKRGKKLGTLLALAGGDLVFRGFTGEGHIYQVLGMGGGLPYGRGIKLRKSVTINRPAADLYRFWRNFENLPTFMYHLHAVIRIDDRRSHWVVKAPAGMKVEWDAEITTERENEIIGWRSLEGAMIDNAGSVRFEPAPGGRGTVVRVQLQYNAPGGKLGMWIAKLFGEEPEQQITEDLRRFKQLMEAHQIPTTEGQPSGRVEALRRPFQERPHRELLRRPETVETASEESFPASDAPAWTAGGGTSHQ